MKNFREMHQYEWLRNGFSLAGVYTTFKTSPVDEKTVMLSMWQHFFAREFSRGQVSWAPSNPQTRKLASREVQLEVFLIIHIYLFVLLSSP